MSPATIDRIYMSYASVGVLKEIEKIGQKKPDNCIICGKISEVKWYEDTWLCKTCFNIIEDLKIAQNVNL